MSALTPAEIAEIVEYTRLHPELALMLSQMSDPRTVLNLIRKKKENND